MESKIFSLTMHGRGVVEGPKKVGVGGLGKGSWLQRLTVLGGGG
jgi:hypothetical protein